MFIIFNNNNKEKINKIFIKIKKNNKNIFIYNKYNTFFNYKKIIYNKLLLKYQTTNIRIFINSSFIKIIFIFRR